MSHSALVTLHALGGLLALVAGCLALRRPSYLNTYFWSLVACIASSWRSSRSSGTGLETPSRALFAALSAFGGVRWSASATDGRGAGRRLGAGAGRHVRVMAALR
jgi:hypothetical protein